MNPSIDAFSVKSAIRDPGVVLEQSWTLNKGYLQSKFNLDSVQGAQLKLKVIGDENGSVTTSISIFTKLSLICSRCGAAFEQEIQKNNEQDYARKTENEDILPISDKLTIDLNQQITDLVQLAVPDFPLHDPHCLGLCSVCGVDLNKDPDHYKKHSDHRTEPGLANHPHLGYNE